MNNTIESGHYIINIDISPGFVSRGDKENLSVRFYIKDGKKMSISELKKVFSSLKTNNRWSLYLLNINKPEIGGAVTYLAHPVALKPREALGKFVEDIEERFWQPDMRVNRGKLTEYMDVVEYDGTAEAKKIYRIGIDHDLIRTDMGKLLHALTEIDVDNDWSFFESAYVIRGRIIFEEEETDVMLISVRKPITTMNHKYKFVGDSFQEIKEKVLSLTPMIDLMIVDQTAYFFTSEAEKLFDMERSYRRTCDSKVAQIIESNILNDSEAFNKLAKKGFNPRRFVTFSQAKLDSLMLPEMRVAMSATFEIPLEEGGDRFDVTDAKSAEKLVKLLCNKGMIDAFDQRAVEVSGARQWQ